MTIARFVIAVIVACSISAPASAELSDEFRVGDVVDVAYGGFECWGKSHSPDDLRQMIRVLRDTGWKGASMLPCGRLDPSYAYEIMDIAEGESSYRQVYCVNSVNPYPTNKSGCVWAAFPRARRSGCKAARALNPGELPNQADVDHFIDVEHHHMSCQGVAMPAVEYAGPLWKSTGDAKDDGAAVWLLYSQHCKALDDKKIAYAQMRLRQHPAEVQGVIDHHTPMFLADEKYKQNWCWLFQHWGVED